MYLLHKETTAMTLCWNMLALRWMTNMAYMKAGGGLSLSQKLLNAVSPLNQIRKLLDTAVFCRYERGYWSYVTIRYT
jgi:hypothetical protein